jgi:HEAT repeat protein
VKALLFVLLLCATAGSVGCRREVSAVASKKARAEQMSAAEPEAKRLKEIDHLGPAAAKDPKARASLARALSDPRLQVRDQAAYWLSKAGAEAIPVLVRALEDTSTQTALMAAYALGLMGQVAVPAVPALTEQLAGTVDTVAQIANWALFQVGPRGSSGFIPLLRNLRFGNVYERAAAARQFSLYGDASAIAIPLLARSLEDPSPVVAQEAADALVRIGPRASLAVQAVLTSPTPRARLLATLVLSQMRAPYY